MRATCNQFDFLEGATLYGRQYEINEAQEIRAFIGTVFATQYGAKVTSFCSNLVAVRSLQGELLAAAGFNYAEDAPLFLEQYLDEPIEKLVARELGVRVSRAEIAEVGNLAAIHRGGTRCMIQKMTRLLHGQGRKWVVFTATRSLINSFRKMGLSPVELVPAQPDRISNAQEWGSYYIHRPVVTVGNITEGFLLLEQDVHA